MDRRQFLKGLAGVLAAGVAPAFIGSDVLMPVKKIWTPGTNLALQKGDIVTFYDRLFFYRVYEITSDSMMTFSSPDAITWTEVKRDSALELHSKRR